MVGTPVAGPRRGETEGLIGFFVNTLVLRDGPRRATRPSASCSARVREARAGRLRAPGPALRAAGRGAGARARPGAHAALPGRLRPPERGRREAGAARPGDGPAAGARGDREVRPHAGAARTGPTGSTGAVEYSADLFDRRHGAAPAAALRAPAGAAPSADPDVRLDALPLLAEAERHQVAAEWAADTRAAYPRERTRPRAVRGAGGARRRTPARVRDGGERLTYAELDARADRLARRLRAAWASGPRSRSAVLLERSAELIVALLAILKAGGAYVPLDPAYPQERLAFMLDDSGARLLVADGAARGAGSRRPASCGRRGATVRRPRDLVRPADPDKPRLRHLHLRLDRPPQGGRGPAPRRRPAGARRRTTRALGPGDRIAPGRRTSPSTPRPSRSGGRSSNGAELVVAPARGPRCEELGDLAGARADHRVLAHDGLFHQMVDGRSAQARPRVRQLLAGGEVLSAAHVRRLARASCPAAG